MFANTELGAHGLRVLFEFYSRNETISASDAAHSQGYTVYLEEIGLFEGYVPKKYKRIIVSKNAWLTLQHFVIYHELGHLCLFEAHEEFLNLSNPLEGTSDRQVFAEIECWCDAFATAMLFGRCGFKILDSENVIGFVTADTDNLSCGSFNWDIKRRLRFEGSRIVELSSKIAPQYAGDLKFLGNSMIHHAETEV